MKKVLFIDCGYDCEEINEPLGIEVLGNYVKHECPSISVGLYSCNFCDVPIKEYFKKMQPDIIGISTHIDTWMRLKNIYSSYMDFCRSEQKEPVIVIGGILATYEYEKILQNFDYTICSIGEGEETVKIIIEQFVKAKNSMELKKALLNIDCPNIAFRTRSDIYLSKRLISNSIPNQEPLEVHPFLNDVLKRNGIVRIEGSRGCPWNHCTFCVLKWKYAGINWRPYSTKKILTELVTLSKGGAKTVFFTDEEFIGGSYQRMMDIINGIREYKKSGDIIREMEFVVSTSARALNGKYDIPKNYIYNVLMSMKEVGFRTFFLGIESGSDSQLQRFCKGSTVVENEEALKIMRRCGIEPDIGYILFDPLVTLEELQESLQFLKRNGLHKHISRFAKRLRLVPYTNYINFTGIKFTQYDDNLVEQNYDFSNAKVQEVYNMYSRWENEHLTLTHSLQAEIRASLSSEERDELVLKLEKIRTEEYDYLSHLVQEALDE